MISLRRFLQLSVGAASLALAEPSAPTALIAQRAGAARLPAELRDYTARFVGGDPVDCGLHLTETPFVTAGAEALKRSVACALEAARGGKAFWAVKQDQGIDSLVFQGLLGTDDGRVYRFVYDSAPCGGPGCPGRFTIERCPHRTVVARMNTADFGCQPNGADPAERPR